MNKLLKLTFLALLISAASCEDATDIIQESELGENNAFRNVDDLRSGLIGVYGSYNPDGGSSTVLFNDLFTDNIKKGLNNFGQGSDTFAFNMRPNNTFAGGIWGSRYATINFANRVLRAWDRIFPTLTNPDDIDKANEIKGQLLAFRALCHFELLQYYSPNYNRSSQGVIIMNFVPEITQVFPRNTVGEVFDFINDDLDDAIALIGDFSSLPDYRNDDTSQDIFYLGADAMRFLRARVFLYEGRYAEAETVAENLIADYPLAAAGAYFDMFNADTPSSELVFSLSRRQDDGGAAGLYYTNSVDRNGSPLYELSNQLLNLFAANDIRREVILLPEGATGSLIVGTDSPNNILLIGKYPGSADGELINDFKMFRSSELYLIKAECEARQGKFSEAETSIQTLRNVRLITGTAPTPSYASNLTLALVDILLERRKELAFEGHRYLDLKRLGAETNTGILRSNVDCASFDSSNCALLQGDYRFTLPIPTSELAPNPGITQNPNY
ncbi:hypothetical protein CHU92_05940 [Flavobacterium cyanobacteriorum]|uniref:RagB/SusD family nutrient uptake outer membrane protein n=1 Tax=Flavobacterium cyanobacteriorum TaxID=2022802 RepID=A0A255ZCC1_9FLAO|nr:RagB/SusD family nutrient uptake outer membrane protein [Flavobacterium cyanobacteriorum]OYQ38250.1 hypothetical protein CHU92_05940 [Flavobacterium cyanobacteriorum]